MFHRIKARIVKTAHSVYRKCNEHDFKLVHSNSEFDYYECKNKGCAHSKGVHKSSAALEQFNIPDTKTSGSFIYM